MLRNIRIILPILIIATTSILIVSLLFMIYVNRRTIISAKEDYSIFETDIFQHNIFLNRSIVTIHDLINSNIQKTRFHKNKKKLDALTRAILGHQTINIQIYTKIIGRLPSKDPLQLENQIAELRPKLVALIEMISDLNGKIRSSTSTEKLDQVLSIYHPHLLESLVILNDALNIHSQVKSSFFKILKDNNLYTIDRVSLNLKLLIFLIFLLNIFTILYFIDQRRNRRLLQSANENLDLMVQKRTKELEAKNQKLLQEIRDREIAEKEIIRQKKISENYLELAAVVFVALNNKGEVTLINKKGCEVLGYEAKDILGKNWFDNFIPKWLKEDLIPVSKQLLAGKIEPVEYYENPILTKSGEEKLIAWHNTVLKNEKDEITGHLSSGEDISEKRKLENQLQQSQKMESIGQLAGGIAHDFNNILYPIIGFTQLSQNDLPKEHPIQENLQDILDGAMRAKDLVKRILLFSRQKEHKLKLTTLQAVIEESYKLLRSSIPANIDLILDLYDGEDFILCDATEIHEIIMNLCTNSYHAITDSDGKITISLKKQNLLSGVDLPLGEYLSLSVKDNGVGIPEKIKNRIFEPYVTTKDIGKGSGLGLSVVYGIVESYKGVINVESDSFQGTEIMISLPISKKGPDKKDEIEKKASNMQGNESILFVDDEESIVKLGTRALENCGYHVTATKDSNEALELFKSNLDAFDLVITDMAMPGIVGSELSEKILEIRPDIPIIICSGYSERLEKEKLKNLKVSAFIDKPLSVNGLTKITREVLDERKAQ